MKKYWLRLVWFLCLWAISITQAQAADSNLRKQSLRKITVKVSAPENIKDSVNSCLNRELRSLGNVALVNNGDWEIGVLIMEVKAGEHQKGFAVSTVVAQRSAPLSMEQPELGESEDGAPNLYYREHWLAIGTNLQKLCTNIITDFDAKILNE